MIFEAREKKAKAAIVPTTSNKSEDGAAAPDNILDRRARIELPGPGRMISNFATELGQALAQHGIYRYAGQAAIYDEKTKTLATAKAQKFRTWMENFVLPFIMTEDGQIEQTISNSDAGAVLASDHFLEDLPEVERVNAVRLPVARSDGKTELLPEGHDSEGKILTARGTVRYWEDMPFADARSFLNGLLSDFPFADESRSKAIAVAAMMTLFGLDLIPPRTILPAFYYRGNQVGLGKGLLVQAAMIPVLGDVPTGVNPKDETELRKFLFAIAREGRPVAFLDNVTGRIASASLESFITASTVTGRVLGSSQSLNCRKNSVVFITGNDCTLSKDMARRTLISELYLAGNPGDRKIENHLDENRLRELRPEILAALFALVREWASAGKPAPTKINPNFVVWSQTIGGIVEHAGFGAIAGSTTNEPAADPREVDMFKLTECLHQRHQTEAVMFNELVSLMSEHGLFSDILKSGEALTKQENTTLGRFLSAQHERAFTNGLRFVTLGQGHARRFAVQRLAISAADTAPSTIARST
jgi:hypothetical protein